MPDPSEFPVGGYDGDFNWPAANLPLGREFHCLDRRVNIEVHEINAVPDWHFDPFQLFRKKDLI
jgi:hypothetical protein